MHPVAPSPPVLDDPAAPRLVLRDGSVATVRRSTPGDRQTMRRFFHELSPESRRLRFFTAGEPTDVLIDRLCDSADERQNVTLVAVRQTGDDVRFIAVGSYLATDEGAAEVAFAVDDRLHGKGLATELLERLAAIAADHGFRRFDATTLTDNHAMIEVFRDSGFEVRSKIGAWCCRRDTHADGVGRGRHFGGGAPAAGDRRVAAPDAGAPRGGRRRCLPQRERASAAAFSTR